MTTRWVQPRGAMDGGIPAPDRAPRRRRGRRGARDGEEWIGAVRRAKCDALRRRAGDVACDIERASESGWELAA